MCCKSSEQSQLPGTIIDIVCELYTISMNSTRSVRDTCIRQYVIKKQ